MPTESADAADVVLVERIRAALHALADPSRAPKMQAYMKSELPYLGVRVPQVRAAVRTELRERPLARTAALRATVTVLWAQASHREERYAATEVAGAPAVRPLRSPTLLGLYERLIVEGAWWDHGDELAHRVGDLLQDFPDVVRPAVIEWQRSPDRWLRRVSVICQLGFRERTDVPLLSAAIEANGADPDVFLRKAIGWALREYARTDPDWVREFVRHHELSPLSVREALKHL